MMCNQMIAFDRSVFSASVMFVNILDLCNKDNTTIFRTISSLHDIIKSIATTVNIEKKEGLRILSTSSGAIILYSDNIGVYPHKHLKNLLFRSSTNGIPVRVGITHGDVECLIDADQNVNCIGVSVNIAARLAFSGDNHGCLLHETYKDFIEGLVIPDRIRTSFPVIHEAITVCGKSHDIKKFKCFPATFPSIEYRDSIEEKLLPNIIKEPKTIAAVALAYDLPHFSSGDRSQLSSRFRSIVSVIQLLKTNHQINSYLLPGGDGGVLVFPGKKNNAYGIALDFIKMLDIESNHKDSVIGVNSRIGLHYGIVPLYKNAEGLMRPTGIVPIIADYIIGDQIAKQADGLILTEALEDVVSSGSSAALGKEFQLLPNLTYGYTKEIRRYVRKRSSISPWELSSLNDKSLAHHIAKLLGGAREWEQIE